MILELILSDLSFCLRIDKHIIETVIDRVKQIGYVSYRDIRQLVEIGIPIIPVIASVLKTSNKQVFELFVKNEENNRITYQDLFIILGIIAQDFKYRELHQKERNEICRKEE